MLQAWDERGPDPESFMKLRSTTDLVLRLTKKTQGIGHCMGSLVFLQRHLWLTQMGMRDWEKALHKHFETAYEVCEGSSFSCQAEQNMQNMHLNYLDDWLIIIAQCQDVLESHMQQLLDHLQCLVLYINMQKRPSRSIVLLGMILDSRLLRAHVSGPCPITAQRSHHIQARVISFSLRVYWD